MENLKELRVILDNAPDGACGYCSNEEYWKFENNVAFVFEHHSQFQGWFKDDLMYIKNIRSISDIKRIVELMEQVEQICNEEDEGVEM